MCLHLGDAEPVVGVVKSLGVYVGLAAVWLFPRSELAQAADV